MRARSLALALVACTVALAARPARAMEPHVAECLASSEKAESLRRDGHYRAARKAFASCGADACPSVVRRDCIASLTELDRLEPTFVFAARDERGDDVAEVVVSVDGEVLADKLDGKPIALDAGQHVISFDPGPRHQREQVSIVARTGEKNRIVSVQLRPRPSSADAAPPATDGASIEAPRTEPLPLLPIVLAGAGVVAVGAFAYLGLSANSDLSSLESNRCAATKTCAQSDVDSIRTRFTIADVSLGVGAVALGAAVWLWFTRDSAKPATTRALDVRFTRDSAKPATTRALDVRATPHAVTVQLEQRF